MAVRVRQSLQVNFFIMRDFTYSGFENQETCTDGLVKTTKKLTSLNLTVQHHSFQFFAKLLRIRRMPPTDSDEYFYTLIDFLASPQCLNIT